MSSLTIYQFKTNLPFFPTSLSLPPPPTLFSTALSLSLPASLLPYPFLSFPSHSPSLFVNSAGYNSALQHSSSRRAPLSGRAARSRLCGTDVRWRPTAAGCRSSTGPSSEKKERTKERGEKNESAPAVWVRAGGKSLQTNESRCHAAPHKLCSAALCARGTR